jgi:lysophospholipase L1-like esterase
VAVRFNTSGSVGDVLTVTSIDGDGRLVINPAEGGSGSANCEQTITKNSHGFRKWTPIYWNGSAWARPTYDSIIPTYIVVDSTTANTFKVSNCGNYSSTLTAGLYYYKGASPGYSLTPTSIPTPLFEVAQSRLILQPLVGFNLAGGSGDVTSAVLADTAAAIRADFPNGIISALPNGDVNITGASSSDLRIQNTRIQFDGKFKVGADSSFAHNPSTDTTFIKGDTRVQTGNLTIEKASGTPYLNIIAKGTSGNQEAGIYMKSRGDFSPIIEFDATSPSGAAKALPFYNYNTSTGGNQVFIIGSEPGQFGARSLGRFSVYDSLNLSRRFSVFSNGTSVLDSYGQGNKEASDLSRANSSYLTVFATDGTLLDLKLGSGLAIAGGELIATAGAGSGITGLTGDVTASGTGSVAATITNNAVTNSKISPNTIDSTRLAPRSVSTSELADDSVTSAKIASQTVDSLDIKNRSITTVKVEDNAITSAKVASQTLDSINLKNRGTTLLKLAQSGATNGQVPKYNSTTGNWEPSADNGAGSALSAPTLSISVISQSEISLSWTPVLNAQLYFVEMATNPGFTTGLASVYYGSGLKLATTGLPANTTYYYRITALGDGFANSGYGTANTTTSAAFNPNSLSGQIAIWDLSNTGSYTTSGGKLTALTDQGTGNNNMTLTGGQQPDYFATGGPANLPYVSMTGSSYFGVPTFSATTSPITIYAVVQLWELTSSDYILNYNTIGGTAGLKVNRNATKPYNANIGLYTGVAPFYSAGVSAGIRQDWMLVKITLRDSASFWVEINNELAKPVAAVGGVINIARLLFYQNVAHVRVFNRILTDVEDRHIKQFLMEKHGLSQPNPILIAFGDSHTSGVTSGGATLGNYIQQLEDNSTVKIYNLGYNGSCVNAFVYPQTPGQNLVNKYAPVLQKDFVNSWVHFQYGTNDAAISGANSTNWDVWKQQYKSYIKAFIDIGFDPKKIILVTPPFATTGYTVSKLPIVVTRIREIASELGIHLYDWYAETQAAGINATTIAGGDGIHLNGAGHLLAANGIAKIITGEELQFIIPQVSIANRDKILNPREGQTVITTDDGLVNTYINGAWETVGGGGGSGTPGGADNQVQVNNSGAFGARDSIVALNNPDRLGVGEITPTARLQVKGTGTTSATTSLLVENNAGTDQLLATDDGDVIAISRNQTRGFRVRSTLSGNTGDFTILPRTVPVSTPGDFEIGSGSSARLFFNNYQVHFAHDGIVSAGQITGTVGNFTNLIPTGYIQMPTSNSVSSWIYNGLPSGATPSKAGIVFKPVGAWNKQDIGLAVTNTNDGTLVTNSMVPFWFKHTGVANFENKLYIGSQTTAPTARLHLAAGTATADTAPLKFTSGTNLTTPEAGAVEYDGTEFYGTTSTASRTIFARVLKGSATLDFDPTSAGAVNDKTITVTGAADGDVVSLSVPNASQTTTGSFSAWVSATNTVTVRYRIAALIGSEDPASGVFKVTVTK